MLCTASPERAELIMEAIQLREFGWTQQQIADDLKVKQYTLSRWFKKLHIGTNALLHNSENNMQYPNHLDMQEKPHPIRLFIKAGKKPDGVGFYVGILISAIIVINGLFVNILPYTLAKRAV